MAERLDLTADQRKQVYALQLTRTQKMQEMREAQDQSADARARMKSANDDFQKGVEGILTTEQKEKYQAMQAEMRDGRRGAPMQQDTTKGKQRKKSRGPR